MLMRPWGPDGLRDACVGQAGDSVPGKVVRVAVIASAGARRRSHPPLPDFILRDRYLDVLLLYTILLLLCSRLALLCQTDGSTYVNSLSSVIISPVILLHCPRKCSARLIVSLQSTVGLLKVQLFILYSKPIVVRLFLMRVKHLALYVIGISF